MAKKNQNEEPEEDNNPFDDDDFGLPDLDYDELEDDVDEIISEEDLSHAIEESVSDTDADTPAFLEEPASEPAPEPVFESEPESIPGPVFESEPEAAPEPVFESDSEALNMDESIEEETETDDADTESEEVSWESDLEAELENEMDSTNFDAISDSFYEEETFDEFDDGHVGEETVGGGVFESDAIADPQPSTASDDFFSGSNGSSVADTDTQTYEPQYSQYLDENKANSKAKFAKVVVLGSIVILGIAAGLYFIFSNGEVEDEKKIAKVEKPVKKEVAKPVAKEEAPEKPAPKQTEEKKEPAKKVEPKVVKQKAAKPVKANSVPAGEITSLRSQNGKSYIIVASFFDEDMAKDHAKKLSGKGKSPYIIAPFKDHRFYRVAIAEFDSFAAAKSNVGAYKDEYGADIWPLKY